MTPHAALRAVAPSTGWSDELLQRVSFNGGADPILPTPFRIGAAGAAAIAASGLAAADLWEQRSGRPQDVAVDLRQATAALRSALYMRLGDGPVPDERSPIMGVYPTKDEHWAYIHSAFPNHFAAALKGLGCEGNRVAVTKTVAGWNALDFEEALIAERRGRHGADPRRVGRSSASSGHCGASRHGDCPHRDSPPEPLPAGERPLAGIRVLDLTRLLAGPICGRILAEHGAEVLKITAPHLPHMGYQEPDSGHGKLSAQLDLRAAGDIERLRELIRRADIFSQSYRPGTLAARGFAPELLHQLRPGIVCLPLCAFSHVGPWAARRGFDTVVQAVSGMAVRQAEAVPARMPGPQFYPVSAIDYCTGYLMAAGAMTALRRRAIEGGSWLVRISLAQVGKWIADLGEVSANALQDIPAEFTPEEIERSLALTETPQGALRHLKPVVQMSETPPHWARPSVPLGYHRPKWPA